MRPGGALAALVVIAGTVLPANADIWVWRDRMGVSHYTNALENVPAEYRSTAMTVARDWERAEPPPEPPPPPEPKEAAAPEPAAAPEGTAPLGAQSRTGEVDAFAEGMRAGLRAAEVASATAVATSTIGPVVQLFAPEPEPRHVHGLVPFAPHRPLPPMKPPKGGRDEKKDEPRRFQGPAGPPPLGAAGPPPFQPSRP